MHDLLETYSPHIPVRRGAPPVALVNATAAQENIERKLNIIAHVMKTYAAVVHKVQSHEGIEVTVCLPKTPRQFNLWCLGRFTSGSGENFEAITRNSHQTLRKYKELYERVGESCAAVANHMSPTQKKESTVAALQRKVAMANVLRQIAERELLRSRREVREGLENEVRLKAEIEAQLRQALETQEGLRADIARLRKEAAQLTSSLKAKSGLHGV